MDDINVAHIAGYFDAVGTITGHVIKGDATIGYRLEPMVKITRPTKNTVMFGKLDAYCDDEGVRYSLNEFERENHTSLEFVIKRPESIKRFLEPMIPYLVSRYNQASLMVDIIIPAIEQDKHLTKEGFYDIMGVVDKLREVNRHGSSVKYTQEYFGELWGIEKNASAVIK